MPLTSYFFFTPHKPKLAERIEKGLNQMIQNGSLGSLFMAYYKPIIESYLEYLISTYPIKLLGTEKNCGTILLRIRCFFINNKKF